MVRINARLARNRALELGRIKKENKTLRTANAELLKERADYVAENKKLRAAINRAITILPLAKGGYVIDELNKALKK